MHNASVALVEQHDPVQGSYKAAGQALEVIPRTLAQNCGTNVIRALTKLRAKHSEKGGSTFGIDGNKGARPELSFSLTDWSLSPASCHFKSLPNVHPVACFLPSAR